MTKEKNERVINVSWAGQRSIYAPIKLSFSAKAVRLQIGEDKNISSTPEKEEREGKAGSWI